VLLCSLLRQRMYVAGDVKQPALEGTLSVTIGAVVTAHQHTSHQMEDFCNKLGKGLLPHKELMATVKDLELIHDGVKYVIRCSQVRRRRSGACDTIAGCNQVSKLSKRRREQLHDAAPVMLYITSRQRLLN
jgi:hypothetical protein